MTPLLKNESAELRFETSNASLASATVKKILWRKPDGITTGFWTAIQSGTKLVYTTVTADLDQVGEWKLRPYIEFAGDIRRPGKTLIKQRVNDLI